MHDTDATMMTSSRLTRALVAASRSRSMFSLIEASFSMYMSRCGM
jgi:hypothetical protein